MHNTKFEAVRYCIVGIIIAAVGMFFNLVKFNTALVPTFFKNIQALGFDGAVKMNPLMVMAGAKNIKNAIMIFGMHFSVLGFVLVFAGAVLVILGLLGFFVFADEKRKNAVVR